MFLAVSEGDLQVFCLCGDSYPIRPFGSSDFKWKLFLFLFGSLKNFEQQNTVDFWGKMCRTFLNYNSLLLKVC